MSRNNQDRTGASAPTPTSPAASLSTNPPLQFVVPTEFVELPSGGTFYPEGHPLHNIGEVEIKYMTAKEEDILTDKTLLKKGLAIDRLLKSVLTDKTINPDNLFLGDRNAILIATRKSGYGSAYDTKLICPICFAHGRHEFDLGDFTTMPAKENLVSLGATQTETGTILMNLPVMNIEVECRLLTGVDEKQSLARQQNNKKNKLPEKNLTSQLKSILTSVAGNSDRSYINSFVEAVTASDSKYIRVTYQKCVPTVELREEYVCGECGASTEIDVPFTTDFFWPK